MKNQFKILCGAVALVVAGQVSAGTTWTLSAGTVTSSGVTATSTGWANTTSAGTTGGSDNYKLAIQSAGSNLLHYGGGLGINNKDGCTSGSNCDVGDLSSTAPEHAIDNNQRYEMVLVSFGQSVSLTNVKFGWTGTSYGGGWGSEYTVMAYTGVGAPTTLVGQTWGGLESGWVTIGNYANATTGTNNAVNAANTYSSYWLIGAYNPLAAGTTSGLGAGNDALKLASVTGCLTGTGPGCTTTTTSQVPEPGSMALFGIALVGLFGLRKHQRS